ncbi:MAG: fibronectin type III domain-containing protein [Anaerolineae bacterium]|nr:fibronectin type III domain-containing protein [Anaerolineae bacterium]
MLKKFGLLGSMLTKTRLGVWLPILLLVSTAACNMPGGKEEESKPVDPDAQLYRMYFNDESGDGVQIRQFVGNLRLADYQSIFGPADSLPEDSQGNKVGAPVIQDGLIWRMTADPSLMGVNLITTGLDGAISSAIDLDGDNAADIVDIRLADGRRFAIVTEGLGMEIFEGIVLGDNPLCNSSLARDLGLPDFGCGGMGEGGGGGAVATAPGSSYYDPIDAMCSQVNSGPGFSTQTHGNSGEENNFVLSDSEFFVQSDGQGGSVTVDWQVYRDEEGNLAFIRTELTYRDADDNLTQETIEIVDADGHGVRVIIKHNSDGSTSTRAEEFETEINEEGIYDSETTSPPAQPPPPPDTPSGSNPGPEGSDLSLEEFCEARESYRGTVEQVAETNLGAFQLGCDDIAQVREGNGDCFIFDIASAADLAAALDPSGSDDGCGPMEQRDTNGDCEPSTVMEVLHGRTALVASANLENVDICPPIVCNPADAALEGAQLTSGEMPTEPAAADTPAPETTYTGEVPENILCFVGPGAEYGTVSSVDAGTQVRIIGIGAEPGWLVIDNPRFAGVACWVAQEDVELPPGFDPSRLPEFEVPALPEDDTDDNGVDSGGGGGTGDSAPAAPSSLGEVTTWGTSTCTVTLTWKDNASNESGFRIYRDGKLIGTVGANTTKFTDPDAPAGLGYNYSVKAYNNAGESSAATVKSKGCFG